MVLKMPLEASFSLSVPSSYKPVMEERSKFRDIFHPAIREVLRRVHPGLLITEGAANYVRVCLEQVLGLVCPTDCPPHNVNDLEEHLKKIFPHPLVDMAMQWGQTKKKAQLCLPVGKLHSLIQRDYLHAVRDSPALTCYLCAVLECLANDILKHSGKYVSNLGQQEIREEDIIVWISTDQVMKELLHPSNEEKHWTSSPRTQEERSPVKTQTYEDAVKQLIHEEKTFLRELKMIKKFFKVNMEPLERKGVVSGGEMQEIFGHIDDVFETSDRFCEALEDALEVDASNGLLGVGHVFEDMLEANEFSVFQEYAMDLLGMGANEEKMDTISVHSTRGSICENRRCAFTVLAEITSRSEVRQILGLIVPFFLEMCVYVLPRLLIIPVFRLAYYADFLRNIQSRWCDDRSEGEDAEALEQAEGILRPMVESIERMLNTPQFRRRVQESQTRLWSRGPRTLMIGKVAEIQRAVEGWEGKDAQSPGRLEFLLEGDLTKITGKDRRSERHVFLFDSVLLACKLKQAKSPGGGPEYRLKEKLSLVLFTLHTKEDLPDVKHTFDIVSSDQPSIKLTLSARNADEKQMWLGMLYTLLYSKPLEKLLDVSLKNEDLANPLRLPMPEMYPFAEPDSPLNIVFEDNKGAVPVIKGATIVKLVERLTYHEYADPAFVKTFLITFRSFTTPARLMELLIERFDIKAPVENDIAQQSSDYNPVLSERRFEKEFKQPVQFRVLNVMRHWVDHHFLDFESDPYLLDKMRRFLQEHVAVENQRRSIKRWINSILKMIERKERGSEVVREPTFAIPFPETEWHLWRPSDANYDIDLMTLHPREVARQLTLIEFELYRAIKPSELVQWNSKDQPEERQLLAPNLLKKIKFTTKITDYFTKSVVTTENVDERAAVVNRLIEVMREFDKLNNFSGVMEIHSALESASVHRLEKTKELLASKYASNARFLEEIGESCAGRDHGNKYHAKLLQANPPCLPFVGHNLTRLHFTEKGNPPYLSYTHQLPMEDHRLINFSQRRHIADIVKEIQQYQYQPYCLQVEPSIRKYFQSLDPYDVMDKKAFEDLLWNVSQKIEPKGCAVAAHFDKKYKYSLKSPLNRPTPLTARGAALGAATSMSSLHSFLTSPAIHRRFSQDNGLHSPTGSGGSTPISPITEALSPSDTNSSPGSAITYVKDSPLLPLHTSYSGGTLKASSSSTTLTSLLPNDESSVECAPPLPPRAPKLYVEDASSPLGFSTNKPRSGSSYSSDGQPSSFPFDDLPPPALPPKSRNTNHSGMLSAKPTVNSLSFNVGPAPLSNGTSVNGDVSTNGLTSPLPPPLPPRKNRPPS